MSEEEQYIKSLSPAKLELVPHDILKWQCCVMGCDHFTRIKDFGISPWYHWRKQGFMNLRDYRFYCGKHWKGHQNTPASAHKLGSGILHLVPNTINFDKQ